MKKGFTLVELIAVITILGIVLLLIIPNVAGSIKKTKSKSYEAQVSSIEKAAERWGTDHYKDITNRVTYLEIPDLVDGDYIDSAEIIDPRNKEVMMGCIKITYSNTYDQYSYKYYDQDCQSLSIG